MCIYNGVTSVGSIIGFANLGEVSMHLTTLEKTQQEGVESDMPKLASSMLVLFVKGLFSSLEFAYAQFPCTDLAGPLMYDPVWEAVARLELCGFRVMALVCDGLAANRKLFRLHNAAAQPTDITYKVKNPYADDGRDLYFICDPPHLIKCVRNAWSNSKRLLWVRGFIAEIFGLIKLSFCSAKERRYVGATLSSSTMTTGQNKHLGWRHLLS